MSGFCSTSNIPSHILQSVIPSSLEKLDELHGIYPWIPSSVQIRPNIEMMEAKHAKCAEITNNWNSFSDYFLHNVFGKPVELIDVENNNKFFVADRNVNGMKVFLPNEFPYAIQGNHWVMWYGGPQFPYDADALERKITQDITEAIIALVGPFEQFDFAWYLNPKVTVPEFFHVQVFWVLLSEANAPLRNNEIDNNLFDNIYDNQHHHCVAGNNINNINNSNNNINNNNHINANNSVSNQNISDNNYIAHNDNSNCINEIIENQQ